MKTNKQAILRITGIGLFTAIVIVLQFLGSFIKLGLFSISLVLLPIVVGAAMYGIGAVLHSKSIDLVMHMEKWVEGKEYDRLGLSEEYITILGVKVPHQIMPVRPGRNLAIIIEVAARNLSLKRSGYSAAHELDRRLNEMIMKRSGN